MTDHLRSDCERFDAHAVDLALGHVHEPLRAELVAHAATCSSCRTSLDELVSVTDHLLLLAPEVEPPAGFEARVLARLDERASPAPAPRRHWLLLAAAAIVIVASAVVVGGLIGREDAPAQAAIVTESGAEVGTVSLVSEPTPHVLVTIDLPRPGPGVRTCELQAADGTWHEVGSWEAADIYTGVWAVGIDDSLLEATAMRITSEGDVVALGRFG